MANIEKLKYPIGKFERPGKLSKKERAQMIKAIKRLPKRLSKAVEGLSEKQLNTPYRKGGWTVAQVVHHLADSHINSYVRFKWICKNCMAWSAISCDCFLMDCVSKTRKVYDFCSRLSVLYMFCLYLSLERLRISKFMSCTLLAFVILKSTHHIGISLLKTRHQTF